MKTKLLMTFFAAVLAVFPVIGNAAENNYASNVKRGRHGAVYVDRIPPVSQRGSYCVPATVSMILRYYDLKCSQRKLAKLFNTSLKNGTNLAVFKTAFQNSGLADSFQMQQLPVFMSQQDYDHLMESYCRTASKKEMKRLKRASSKSSSEMFKGVNLDVFRRCSFTPDQNKQQRFSQILKKYVDAGHPLFWSVWMGLDVEYPRNEGHARVLCGYRTGKDGTITEVLYIDSWSRQTDRKSIPADRAVMMTTALFSFLPVSAPDPLKSGR